MAQHSGEDVDLLGVDIQILAGRDQAFATDEGIWRNHLADHDLKGGEA